MTAATASVPAAKPSSGSAIAPGVKPTDFNDEDEYKDWTSEITELMKKLVLELNFSKQILQGQLEATPTPTDGKSVTNVGASKRGARAVRNKISRAEQDIMASVRNINGAFRSFESTFLGQVGATGGNGRRRGMQLPHTRSRTRSRSNGGRAA